MNFHNITKDDMNNGSGLRVVLWLSGCDHRCDGCQNPITWNPCDGIVFDNIAKQEIFAQLNNDYISGITFSGGDPFSKYNIEEVAHFIHDIKSNYNNKNIWVYTGYTYEFIFDNYFYALQNVDVLVDGKFVQDLSSIKYHWAGSTNQRIIDVQKSLKEGEVILWA